MDTTNLNALPFLATPTRPFRLYESMHGPTYMKAAPAMVTPFPGIRGKGCRPVLPGQRASRPHLTLVG